MSWFRNVYVAGLDGSRVAAHPAMSVREVGADDVADWLEVTRAGFDAATPEEAVRSDEMARASRAVPGATVFLAELDGVPIGCGTLTVEGGLGWLGGAATVPSGRRRGVQGALVRHRMAAAQDAGCEPRSSPPCRPATRPATWPASASRSPTARPC